MVGFGGAFVGFGGAFVGFGGALVGFGGAFVAAGARKNFDFGVFVGTLLFFFSNNNQLYPLTILAIHKLKDFVDFFVKFNCKNCASLLLLSVSTKNYPRKRNIKILQKHYIKVIKIKY